MAGTVGVTGPSSSQSLARGASAPFVPEGMASEAAIAFFTCRNAIVERGIARSSYASAAGPPNRSASPLSPIFSRTTRIGS